MGISLEEAMRRTTDLCTNLRQSFAVLETHGNEYLDSRGTVTADDFFLFPFLRNLTLVRALNMPVTLERYLQDLSQRCGVPLYSDRAI